MQATTTEFEGWLGGVLVEVSSHGYSAPCIDDRPLQNHVASGCLLLLRLLSLPVLLTHPLVPGALS
ncbi:hypothetical protein GZL_07055 [Streptomyces sp. 769]|nr:hypothetical protein GZL_07055 [Streptomyces sp. 769]